MLSCTANCYDLARQLSQQGFTVAVRTTVDRPRVVPALRYSCASCGTRYELRATRPQTVESLYAARSLFPAVA